MTFPLYYLIFPYLTFLAIWGILSLVGLYHLMRYGFRHIGLLLIVLIYLGGSALILQFSYTYLAPIDWSTPVGIFTQLPAAMPSFGTSF